MADFRDREISPIYHFFQTYTYYTPLERKFYADLESKYKVGSEINLEASIGQKWRQQLQKLTNLNVNL